MRAIRAAYEQLQLQLLPERTESDFEPCFRAVAGDSVLATIQGDVLDLRDGGPTRAFDPGDASICFVHACRRLREVDAC